MQSKKTRATLLNRVLTMTLTALLAATLIPLTAFADEGQELSGEVALEETTALLEALDATPISDFDYITVNNKIRITKYKGNVSSVIIPATIEGKSVTWVDTKNSNITSLDVSACTELTTLYCEYNQLTTLDVSKNTELRDFGCAYNQLTAIDLSQNRALSNLWCNSNKLTTLDVSKNTAITYLQCHNNQLTTLDVSQNTALAYLICNNNQLTTIDVSQNMKLTELDCYNNQLTTLEVSQNTWLRLFDCRNNYISDQTLLDTLSARFGQSNVLPQYRHIPLEGPHRYSTAAAIVSAAYPTGLEGVIVAYGDNFPDALTASSLAGLLDYPIILVQKDAIPAEAKAVLAKLTGQKKIIVTGDDKSISAKVLGELKTYGTPTRLGGATRFETGLKLYEYGKPYNWAKTAIFATGNNYADALSISPYAAFAHAPVFLVGSSVSGALKAVLSTAGFTNALILGDVKSVSGQVASELTTILGFAPKRLGGTNRYETCSQIAQWSVSVGKMHYDSAGVATGKNFPDALVGGPLLARLGGVLLLAEDTNMDTLKLLADNSSSIHTVHTFGSVESVSTAIRHRVADNLGWPRGVMK